MTYGLYASFTFFGMIIPSYILISHGIGQKKPLIIFGFTMVYLLAVFAYYYRTAYGIWQMDITSPLMIAVQKCTSLAWNLFDGKKQTDALLANNGIKPTKPVLRTSHQRRVALNECPSLFGFVSWMMFPISLSVGPATEYAMFESSIEIKEAPLRSRYKLFWKQLVLGAIFMVYFVHPVDVGFVFDKEFISQPFWRRVLKLHICMSWTRLRYYSAWCLTNAAMILAGAGFDGNSWENAMNVFVFRLEFARRPKAFIANWNCGTQRFLKYYIYVRGPTDPKTGLVHPFMQYVTFIVSGIWHGWYAGYLLHFTILFLINVIDRLYFALFPIKYEERPALYGYEETQRELREIENKNIKEKHTTEKKDEKLESNSMKQKQTSSMSDDKKPVVGNSTTTCSSDENIKTDLLRTVFEWVVTQVLFNYAAIVMAALVWPTIVQANKVINWWGLKTIVALIVILQLMTIFKKKPSKTSSKKDDSSFPISSPQ
eukprot:MONOS_11138.1-p1 / transcript=MONOS_11138.1 / gene=MONOS_11138 / organism=Monocercomonoides_exilis_PA203 / gene_product=lysophospholipid acyltransferase [EC:2.3.1.51 2.3.1.23 2.3.1.-] / transcript_product=lysophospholipid acyltransferase [EC:2.3.1.51 2.3.1.23 2.3.1.-] / location=Mono_scaffold00543:2070-3829(+) / protein_length=485 / sequence_SO=supercontig / SO=protein_coding / is_pseudo=false